VRLATVLSHCTLSAVSSSSSRGLDGDVDGPGRQIVCPDRVAAEHGGVADGEVVLEVAAAPFRFRQGLVAAAVDEQAGLVEVALLTGGAAKLGEADLDLGVSTDGFDPAFAEDSADEVGCPAGNLEQPVVGAGRCSFAGDRGLEQVAKAVQFVTACEVWTRGVADPVGRRRCRGSRPAPGLQPPDGTNSRNFASRAGSGRRPCSQAAASRNL